VVASNEVPHGLRAIGSYAVVPLIIGYGAALWFTLIDQIPAIRVRTKWIKNSGQAILIGITFISAMQIHRRYQTYWQDGTWFIFERDRSYGEWFFRDDKQDVAEWIAEQNRPILMPIAEIRNQTSRAWLIQNYPDVETADENFSLPTHTLIVVPWELEKFDFVSDTVQYALLANQTITLLPPFDAATQHTLQNGLRNASAVVMGETGEPLLAYYALPQDLSVGYISRQDTLQLPALVYNNELALQKLWGNLVLHGDETEVTFALEWGAASLPTHHYDVRLGIIGQDYQGYNGVSDNRWRWIFPPTIWEEDSRAYSVHTLRFNTPLPTGAYRILVGARLEGFPFRFLPVYDAQGEQVRDAVTKDEVQIAWLKVAQPTPIPIPETAFSTEVIVAEQIALTHAHLTLNDDGQAHLQLFWQALVERPSFDATIFVHIQNGDGTFADQDDIRPWGGQYPTFIWDKRERVQTDHFLDLQEIPLENLQLCIGMYTLPSVERLPIRQNNMILADNRACIGTLANFLVN
jgi:hypothetical protein